MLFKRNAGELIINNTVPNVLVIESDEKAGIMITSALEGAGFMVTCARDGLEGLEKLIESSIDVIVMGSTLPRVYGEDARIRIRQASYRPIIVIGENHDVAESLELGADAFMPKPPLLRELVARVRSLLLRTPAVIKRDPDGIPDININDGYPRFMDDYRHFFGDN